MKLNKRWLLSVRACGQDKLRVLHHEPTEQDVEAFYNQISKTCKVRHIEVKVVYSPDTQIMEPRDYQGSKMRDQCDI